MSKKDKIKDKLSFKEDIESVLKANHKYAIQYDYKTETDCEKAGCDQICRCAQIYDEKIIDFNASEFALYLITEYRKNFDVSPIDAYIIHRVVVSLLKEDNFDVHICQGYYGQEISGATISSNIAMLLANTMRSIFNEKTLEKKVLGLLQLEYGFILPPLVKASMEIKQVDPKDIVLSNDRYMTKLDPKKIECYKNYNDIVAVCWDDGNDKYRIIDGYHRTVAALNRKRKSVEIIAVKPGLNNANT